MKKYFFGGIAVVVAVMALNVSFSANSNDLSDIFFANVEALASSEYEPPPAKKLAYKGPYACCESYPNHACSGGNPACSD